MRPMTVYSSEMMMLDSKKGCKACEVTKNVLPENILEFSELSVVDYCTDPVVLGHLIIAPRRHVENLVDLTTDEMADILRLSRKYGNALLSVLDPMPEKIYFCTFSEHPDWHLHFHLIPRNQEIPKKERGPRIFSRKVPAIERSNKAIEETVRKIKAFLNGTQGQRGR
jgi:diadenosine tetraphosphate (Ap4A) HIT family hydrolase